MYPDDYGKTVASQNVSSVRIPPPTPIRKHLLTHAGQIAFLGTVLGQLAFGFLVDMRSRKFGMLLSSAILITFSILCAGAYGVGGVTGILTALTAYRFFLGIGIGGEYPSGSVACAEATTEQKRGTRNRWFVLFTNVCINVVS